MEFMTGRQLLLTYCLEEWQEDCAMWPLSIFFRNSTMFLQQSVALGASASVMAIVTAVSFWSPIILFTSFYRKGQDHLSRIALFVFDFFAIPGGNSGGHWLILAAHYGDSLCCLFRKDFCCFLPGSNRVIMEAFFLKGKGTGSSRQQYHERPKTDDEYNAEKIARQKKDRPISRKSRKEV